jgi:hypothetical protein
MIDSHAPGADPTSGWQPGLIELLRRRETSRATYDSQQQRPACAQPSAAMFIVPGVETGQTTRLTL